jgi:hypothetical protein
MDVQHPWQSRNPHRLSDPVWKATLSRVRGEFDEMPCLRLTREQACALLGLPEPASGWVLERLAKDGFLFRTRDGLYMRRQSGV